MIVVILLMSLLLSLSLYFLSFSSTEKKISDSQYKGLDTYHLAEAGIEEMVWRLKNDSVYKDNFENEADWSAEFSRTDPFGPGTGSYEVSIDNVGLAEGDIVSTGTLPTVSGTRSQRVVKTTVYKAMASSSRVDGYALFADNDIDLNKVEVEVPTSSMHANHNVEIYGDDSNVIIENDLEAVHKFDVGEEKMVSVGGSINDSFDYAPAPDAIEMPAVSFDDESDPEAYVNKADITYTEDEFEDLLKASRGGSLVLDNDIIYVTGDVRVNKEIDMTIKGLLAANGDMEFGGNCGEGKDTTLVVTSTPSSPSGLVANGNLRFNHCFNDGDVYGVVYATKDVIITNFHGDLYFEGGMYGRNIEVFSLYNDNKMIFNKEIVDNSLDVTDFSPVVSVEHWEEEY